MPIVTAAVAAIGTFFASLTVASIGTFLIKTIASIAVNVLVNTLLGSKAKKQPAIGVTGALSSGGDVPRSFILGQSRVDGSLVYRNTWGNAGATPNAYYSRVIALSDLPHSQLLEFYVDGEKVTVGNTKEGQLGYPIAEYTDASGTYLWINYYDGTQTTADPLLVAHASAERPYPATRVGVGMCYAVITARSKPALFSAGWPTYHFVLSSTPFYDLSKDSSQGGAGPQRWNDPTTWGGDGDDLPVVQAYNILRGVFYNSTWFYGTRGLSSGRLPSAKWIAEINKCRTPTEGLNGFAPRYRCSGELRVSSEPASALEAALMTCSGRIADIGGVYYPHVGEPEAPVASFTDSEILATEEESFVPFRRLHDTVNGITATYTEPSEGYVTKAAPPLYSANFEAEDGNRRLTSNVDLQMVPYSEQVQRLMAEALAASRRNRRHTLFLPPAYSTVLNNEVLAWTSEKYSYAAKQFIINGRVLLDDGSIALELGEVDPEDYTPPAANSYVPVTPSPVVVVRPSVQSVLNFAVAPDSVVDGTAQGRLPAILATWDTSLDDIEALHVRVRLDGEAASTELLLLPSFEDGSARIISGILPDTAYEVAARLVPNAARAVSWTSWLKVTTPDVRLGLVDLADEILLEITGAQEDAAAAAALALAADLAADQVQSNLDQAVIDGNTTDAAIAQSVSDLSVTVGSNYSAITTQGTALATLEGYAAASYTLRAQAGSSGALLELVVADDPSGPVSVARIAATNILLLGSVATDMLTVGMGRNLLSNTDFTDGLIGWVKNGTAPMGAECSIDIRPSSATYYSGNNYPTFEFYQNGVETSGGATFEARPEYEEGNTNRGISVEEGTWLEISAKLIRIRCEMELRIRYYDIDDVFVSASANFFSGGEGGSGNNPETWPTYWGKHQVPTGAVKATLWVKKYGTSSGTDSYVFMHKPQLAVTHANATEPAPFSPGGTTMISGGKVKTNTIYTSHLNTVEFAAAGLAVFGNALMSTNFNGTVNGSGVITADGTVGWALDKAGNLVLNNLVARGSIVDGAVSDGGDMTAYIYNATHIPTTTETIGTVIGTGGLMGWTDLWTITLRGEYRDRKVVYGSYNSGSNTTNVSTHRTQLELWQREKTNGGSWGSWYRQTNGVDSSSSTAWSEFEHSYTMMGKNVEMQFKLVLGSGGNNSAPMVGNHSALPDVEYLCVRNVALSVKAVKK